MEVDVTCPVCKQRFKFRINWTPKAIFSWSGRKSFLTLDVTTTGIEHECIQAPEKVKIVNHPE